MSHCNPILYLLNSCHLLSRIVASYLLNRRHPRSFVNSALYPRSPAHFHGDTRSTTVLIIGLFTRLDMDNIRLLQLDITGLGLAYRVYDFCITSAINCYGHRVLSNWRIPGYRTR